MKNLIQGPAFLSLAVSLVSAASSTRGVAPSEPSPAAKVAATLRSSAPTFPLDTPPPELCYAPGTSREVIRANARAQRDLFSSLQGQGFQFSDGSRWSTTATNGSGLTLGQVTTITWNIVPDGTPIGALGGIAGESTAASNLRAFLDGIYGNEATWLAHFQTVFTQWGALTGVNYVKETADDGVAISGANTGSLGVRADVRIGGHFIDGNFNVLAYNFFPNGGDMVIDTGDSYYSTSGLANSSLGFRNMLAHEHGHGLGFNHSCPGNGTKLMEPSLSTAFTHAQHDDKLAGWRGYGDDRENNETSATASSLGSLGVGTVNLTELSADDDSDVDFYSFTVTAGKRAAVTMTPTGSTYLAGPQNGDGSCSAGTSFNALAVNDLGVELRSTDGITVLASSTSNPAGVAESIGGTSLPGAGTYFVRVSAGAVNSVQGYNLAVTITDNTGSFVSIDDVAVTEGNSGTQNATFTLTRSGTLTGTVSVSVQTAANTALSPSDFTATGPTTLTFGPGVTSQNFSVPVVGDTLDEPNETFFVNLTSPSAGLTIEDTQGIGTINDNDNAPTISINDVSLAEGNSGSTNANFTASLSAASGQTVTVNYATADGTGTAGGVTQSNATAITIPSSGNGSVYPSNITVAGATGTVTKAVVSLNSFSHTYPQDVDILLVGPGGQKIVLMADVGGGTDAAGVTLTFDDAAASSLTNGAISSGTFKPTNLNDGEGADAWGSPAPASPYGSTLADFIGNAANGTWSLYVVDDTGGDSGSIAAGWTLSLTTSGGDYTPASGTLTYAPGETTKTIAVPIIGDGTTESNETFFVNLSGATNATISDAQGQGTITNDDGVILPTLSISDPVVAEGNSGSVNANFVITLSAVSASTVTVSAATANGTATSGADYTATGPTTITFNPGETSKTFAVPVQGDTTDEVDEQFVVNLTSPSNATIADSQGSATITDDDNPPALAINDPTVTEGSSAVFTVSLSAASGKTVTVSAVTANGTASSGADYTATGPTTITFNPGVTSQTFSVATSGNTLDEDDETFFVNLSSATNATLPDTQGQATITDDDALPSVSIANATGVTEGSTLSFTVSLSTASGRSVNVTAASANGTATAGSDYTAAGPTVITFGAGETSKTFTVNTTNDVIDEATETVLVNLTSPVNATIGTSQGSGNISDNDSSPTVSIGVSSAAEASALNFPVTLSAASGLTVTVSAVSSNGSATAGVDYTATGPSTITFNPGETSKTFSVPTTSDTIDEDDETVTATLSSPSNATIGTASALGTILDDDPLPSLSVADLSLLEGTGGSVSAVVTITLAPASGRTVTVSAQTANSTAGAPSDYTATGPTTITFTAGQTSKTFTVPIATDALDEVDESFFVNLSGATNAVIGDAQGSVVITDDDALPSLAVLDATVAEGTSGLMNAVVTISLTPVSGRTVTVSAQTANSNAIAGADYTATGPGTLTFNAGETSKTFTVPITTDALDEVDETFHVNLSSPVNAVIGDSQNIVTITDDDAPPVLSILDKSATEGSALGFSVVLSAASGKVVTVSAQTSDGTATAGSDYTAAGPSTLTFNAGETSKTFTVTTTADATDESDETLTATLSAPANASLGDPSATGTIVDDDGSPTITIDDAGMLEGNSGSANLAFTVRLLPAAGSTVTIQALTSNGTATSGSDYTATGPTTLTFAAGETTKTFNVPILGDTAFEADETFLVNLLSLTGPATVGDSQSTGTILNDEAASGTVSIGDAVVSEGYLSGSTMTFPVFLSAPSIGTTTVQWTTQDLPPATSATPGSDYTAATGTITFLTGESQKTITVAILGDAIVEPNETLIVALSNPIGVTLGDGTAIGTIFNDDGPTISVTDYKIAEGTGAGTTNLVFTVITSATSPSPITVQYTTADGTANFGSDYTTTAGTLTIPANVASVAVSVPVARDAAIEPNETVLMNLLGATGATIFDNQGVGTIEADDGTLVSIRDKTSTEGNVGTTPITFTLTVNTAAHAGVTVDWATANGTATAPTDYTATNGTVSFAAGETTKTVTVQIVGDTGEEPYESFFVNLSNPTGAAIGDGQAQGTITNTDGSTDRSRLMFHNFVTNRLYRWHMKNGNTLDTFNWVTPWATDPGWTVGAVADFDQDGQLDYLWHNVNDGRLLFWYIDGDNLKGFQFLPYVLDVGWSVSTTLDANGDGAVDIVYYDTRTPAQSGTSGRVAVFLHDNGTLITSYLLNQTLPITGTVRVVNSVDANNDGDDELVLYNSATGQVTAWDVTGATVGATITYPNLQSTTTAFTLVSTRTDFNDDGLPDFLWHNPTPTGVFSVWFMNNDTTRLGVGQFQPFTATDPVWRVVGSANVW